MSTSEIFWFYISIIWSNILFVNAQYGEYNKITIEGGERALMKIFEDFKELKEIVNSLKNNDDFCHHNNVSIKEVKPYFDERFDRMPQKCYPNTLPKDCAAATACTKRSGIYKIQVEKYSNEPFYVACDDETENGDWLIIQKRQDNSVDFFRNWQDYEEGFGDIEGEYFIGLKKLHALTNYNGPQELLIILEDANATRVYAKYDAFAIGNETESYNLKRLGKYSGTAGDSMRYQIGMKFSTKDRDNDKWSSNCALNYTGAWWYNACHTSDLNGKYGDNTHAKGVVWNSFRGQNVSLTYTKMMIRRSMII